MILLKSAAVISVVALGIAAGCSSPAPATPRAAVTTQMGPGSLMDVNDMLHCRLATEPWITIGDNAHPVSDGDQQGGTGVNVSCTVRPDGDGFAVTANAVLQGQGSLTVTGHFVGMATTPPATAPAQTGITGVFQQSMTGSFRDTGCTVDFSANQNMGFAPGRVWGQITCPNAHLDAENRTCQGFAEFRFENCTQG